MIGLLVGKLYSYKDFAFCDNQERTKDRPLARGDMDVKQAFGFLALQLTAGLGVLTQLNNYR